MNQDETFDQFLESIKKQMLIFAQKDEETEEDFDDQSFEQYVDSVLSAATNEYESEFLELLNKYKVNQTLTKMSEELYQKFYRQKHYVNILADFAVVEMFVNGKRVVKDVPKLETIIKKNFGIKINDKGYHLILFYLSTEEFYERLIFYEIFNSSFSQDV